MARGRARQQVPLARMTSRAAVRRITVSTGFDAEYAAFYLQGLRELEPSVAPALLGRALRRPLVGAARSA